MQRQIQCKRSAGGICGHELERLNQRARLWDLGPLPRAMRKLLLQESVRIQSVNKHRMTAAGSLGHKTTTPCLLPLSNMLTHDTGHIDNGT